jgi:hypothetical protein
MGLITMLLSSYIFPGTLVLIGASRRLQLWGCFLSYIFNVSFLYPLAFANSALAYLCLSPLTFASYTFLLVLDQLGKLPCLSLTHAHCSASHPSLLPFSSLTCLSYVE